MDCRIGQKDICGSSGCKWLVVFGYDCSHPKSNSDIINFKPPTSQIIAIKEPNIVHPKKQKIKYKTRFHDPMYRRRLKLRVFNRLGGRCAKCGEKFVRDDFKTFIWERVYCGIRDIRDHRHFIPIHKKCPNP